MESSEYFYLAFPNVTWRLVQCENTNSSQWIWRISKLFRSAGLLIFRGVAEPGISSKSAKSREIHKNTRNPTKFSGNLTKYMSAQHIWKLSWLLGLLTAGFLLAVSVLIYLETSSLQRENNILKLPGVLRLMLRKTGKQRCKNPGGPSVDRGNWGWELSCARSSWRMLRLVKDYASVNSSSAHTPPRANPRALAFFKKIGRIPRGGDEKRGQMPRPRDRRLPTLFY